MWFVLQGRPYGTPRGSAWGQGESVSQGKSVAFPDEAGIVAIVAAAAAAAAGIVAIVAAAAAAAAAAGATISLCKLIIRTCFFVGGRTVIV